MRAYPYSENLEPQELNTDTRLIGRSVWNTEWVLVIPGATLLADPDMGIDRFLQDVNDIYVYFQTYAYAGTMAAAAEAESAQAGAALPAAGIPAARVAADAKAMPQPDALFYGVAMRDGAVLKSGTLTAVLPRGGVVTTQIAAITGTDYNYVLAVPLSAYDPGVTPTAIDSARIAETISFTVDGVPAVLRDKDGTYQAYRIGAAGSGYSVTVDVSGPGSYPLGDVNVSGRRDSADALLVLKYDVGLTPGVTTWPPGPGTVYLPLCDVTQDGRCNSSDALRILMCDVAMASCPSAGAAAADAASLGDAQPAFFRLEQEPDGSEWVVRVVAESPHAPLGAAVLSLTYDPARLAVVSCSENPAGRMDLAVCNGAYAEGTVKYTGITTGGIVEAAPLVEIRFGVLDPTLADQLAQGTALAELAVEAAFDLDLNALRAEYGQPVAPGAPLTIYLPLITNGWSQSPGPGMASDVIPDGTLPPAAEPPAAEPQPIVPPAEGPPAVEPPAEEPPAVEPPATEPAPITPPAEEPPASEPAPVLPPADDPPALEPAPPAIEAM